MKNSSEKNCLIFLAGTKRLCAASIRLDFTRPHCAEDLVTQESFPCAVPLRDVKKYAETINAVVFETSAKVCPMIGDGACIAPCISDGPQRRRALSCYRCFFC